MMCCSDPDSVARIDVLDLDPVVPPDTLVRDDGLVWMNTAGRLYVSRNEGQIFVLAYQGWDCDGLEDGDGWDPGDGLTGGDWKSTEVHWKRAHVADPVGVHVDGPNFRSVEIQDGKGQRIGRLSSGPAFTFEQEIPISGSFKAAEPLPTVWWYRRVGASKWTLSKEYPNPTEPGSWEVVACTSARVEPVRFDNTPPPLRPIPPEKIAAARKAVEAITAREKGLAGTDWPSMWIPSAVYPGYRIGPRDATRVPDTEPGRRAAWELEGK